ncbi:MULTISPECIES: hypothetical protein [Maribacter]|uniref:hypothetical protein n=1 Tax=Maribacter TaxID=252356 RepID=UPI000478D8F2|nr:hypothetical protein [Maribacter sp. Hel_I_7]
MKDNSRVDKIGSSKLWLFEASSIMLDFKFDPILAYLDESKGMIAAKELELRLKIEEWDEKYHSHPESPEAFDYYEQEIINQKRFPELLNNSIFLVIYSVFEDHFKGLCNMAGNRVKSKLLVTDISSNGGYINQCRKFMIKVIGLELIESQIEWTEIKKFQLIRNAIAHNKGQIKEVKSDLNKFIETKPGISYSKNSSLLFISDIEFLQSFIDVIKKFFVKLNKNLIQELSKV